jgi:hypothetical protein
MKRIVDLNEQDIKRIVLRVIEENQFADALKQVGDMAKTSFSKLLDDLKGYAQGEKPSSETEKPSSETPSGETPKSDEESKSNTSIGKVSAKGQKLLNDPIFKNKLKEISNAIKIDENSIIKLMKHESGLDPSIKNSIGCVGLIQFCPSGGRTKTVNGKTYTIEELGGNLEAQMDAIKDFWLSGYQRGKIKNAADLYLYNFFPVAAGKPDDFVLQAKGLSAEKVAKANPGFNRKLGKPVSSPLTVGDMKKYYRLTGMV